MTYTRSETKTFLYFIGAAIAGPILLWNSTGDLFTAWQSGSWPTVQATVLNTSIQTSSSGRKFSKSTKYEPYRGYEYQINGQTFQGERIAFTTISEDTMPKATETLLGIVPGPTVAVHYDPKDPGNSVIVTGTTGGQWTKFLIGLGMLAFAFVMGRKYWKGLQGATLRSRDGGFQGPVITSLHRIGLFALL